jgi:hypothetical protein
VLGSVQGGTKNCVRQGAKKAAEFAYHKNSSKWENLASRRKLSRIYTLFKAYSGERACKAIGDITTGTLSEQCRS